MRVFRRLTRAALETDRNLVVTTDHSGEAAVPFFALLTTQAGAETLGVESSRQDAKIISPGRKTDDPAPSEEAPTHRKGYRFRAIGSRLQHVRTV